MSPARSGGRYGRRRRKKREACREPGAKRRAIRQATSPGAGASDAGYAGSSEPAGAKDPRSRHCRLERGKDERCRLCRQQRGDGGERTQGRHCRPKRTGRGRAEERGAAAAEKRGGGDGARARGREEPRPERSEAAATGRTAGEKRAAEGERSDARRRACAGERGGARGRSGAKRTRRRATAGAFLLQHHQHHKPSELRAAKERASRQASEQRERGKLSSRISFPKS